MAEREPFRKYRFGGVHYARNATGVAWRTFGQRTTSLRVDAGDRSEAAVAVMVQLHSRYSYFGRLPLSIGDHQPGSATVMVARSLTRGHIASILSRVATGRSLDGAGDIEIWTGIDRFEIVATDGPVPFQADGEMLGTPACAAVDVSPDRLTVLVPG